jgi:hypothetical protein
MCELGCGRLLERHGTQAARIDGAEYMPNGAVLTRGIERLKDQEHGVAAVGEQLLLPVAEYLYLRLEVFLPSL